MPVRSAVVSLLLVLLASACDNPTGVGADLVGVQGGDPLEAEYVPVVMAPSGESDVTGGSGTLQRMLAGTTDDPALGRIRAVGHMDFVTPSTGLTTDFAAGQVSEVTLFLGRSYVYGDTSGTLTLRLDEIAEEWTATEARADTSFAVGSLVTEHTFPVTAPTPGISLPDDWVTRWDATLRGSTFGDDFHGFRFEAVSGDAIVGFQQFGSYLRAVAGGDTVFFPASRTHSSLEFQEPFSTDPETVMLQDGRGAGIVLQFDLDDGRLDAAALSRVRLEIPFDSVLTKQAPAGYVRPAASPTGLSLDAVSIDPPARYSIDAVPAVVNGKVRFESADLTSVVSLVLSGGSALDHFELRVNPTLVSLDVIRLAAPAHPGAVPRFVLTAVPFE